MTEIKARSPLPKTVHDAAQPAPATVPAAVTKGASTPAPQALVDSLERASQASAPPPVDAPPPSHPSEQEATINAFADAARDPKADETVAQGLLGVRDVFDLGLEGRSRWELRKVGGALEKVKANLAEAHGLGEKPITTDPAILGPAIEALQQRLEAIDGDGTGDAIDVHAKIGEVHALQTEIARLSSWLKKGATLPANAPMTPLSDALIKQSCARVAARVVADAQADVLLAKVAAIEPAAAKAALAEATASYQKAVADLQGLKSGLAVPDMPVVAITDGRMRPAIDALLSVHDSERDLAGYLAQQAIAEAEGRPQDAEAAAKNVANTRAVIAEKKKQAAAVIAELHDDNDADPLKNAAAWPSHQRIAAAAYKLAGRLSLRAHSHS